MSGTSAAEESILNACRTGDLSVLQGIIEATGKILSDMSPEEIEAASVGLPPIRTMLETAAEGNQIYILRYLRPLYPAKIGHDIAILAICSGSIELFSEFASHDPEIITHCYGLYGNCLWCALRLPNRTEFVKYLLEHNANPNASEHTLFYPLTKASAVGDVDIMKLLLHYGARLEGSRALRSAVRHGRYEAAHFVLEQGLSLDSGAQNGQESISVLYIAVLKSYLDVIRLLLEHEADPQWQNREGKSSLQIAEEKNDLEAVELLKHSRSLNSVNTITPL